MNFVNTNMMKKAACFATWCSPIVESCLCPNQKPHAIPWDDDLTNCLFSNCTFAEQISMQTLTSKAVGRVVNCQLYFENMLG